MVSVTTNTKTKAAFCTLGCKVNYYESKAISEEFEKLGYEIVPFEKGADVYIINTCAVTSESERKASQMIRRASSFGGTVIVTGCAVQLHPDKYAQINGVDFVCGNREKMLTVLSLFDKQSAECKKDFSLEGADYEDMHISGSERTRAYVKVEDGCDAKCAYCIIRKARGPIRSRSISSSIDEIKSLAEKGYREVVLCGIEISGFGKDTKESLVDLIEETSKVEGIERIRLSSVDPSFLQPKLVDRLALIKQFTPYFHLSLQSGCSKTLARMRRKYTAEKILEYTDHIRKVMPDAEFAADIIVGFPGESDEDFTETLEYVRKIRLQHFHIFTYSKRPGTEAAQMDGQILPEVKRQREKALSAVRTEVGRDVRRKYIGRDLKVLFETYENGFVKGHSANFIEICAPYPVSLHNKFALVRITYVSDDGAVGKIINVE